MDLSREIAITPTLSLTTSGRIFHLQKPVAAFRIEPAHPRNPFKMNITAAIEGYLRFAQCRFSCQFDKLSADTWLSVRPVYPGHERVFELYFRKFDLFSRRARLMEIYTPDFAIATNGRLGTNRLLDSWY